MILPDCPICKTNKYMVEAYNASTHASDGKRVVHSNSFECSCCGGDIYYSEERIADKICDLKINYRQKNYTPLCKEIKTTKTWKDYADWENEHHPAFAEGYACPPGSPILIEDENGEQKVIPFDPETLLLDTKVIDWHYKEIR